VIVELDDVLFMIDYLILGKLGSKDVRWSYHLQQVTILELRQSCCAASIEKIIWLCFELICRPGKIDGLAFC
jgi:hypothetical protein